MPSTLEPLPEGLDVVLDEELALLQERRVLVLGRRHVPAIHELTELEVEALMFALEMLEP
jgi:hypothetical protein